MMELTVTPASFAIDAPESQINAGHLGHTA